MIRRILFFLILLVSTQIFSQRSSSSPYSIFGVGEEFGTRTVEQISMGGIGAAYTSPSEKPLKICNLCVRNLEQSINCARCNH